MHFLPSLYIDIPILLLLQRREMPPCMSRGQTTYWRGPTSIHPHADSLNIVQRLGPRELTGWGWGVYVHQHYSYRVHVELTKGAFGSRSFETRFLSYESCDLFSITLIEGYPEGLCACFLVREGLALYGG